MRAVAASICPLVEGIEGDRAIVLEPGPFYDELVGYVAVLVIELRGELYPLLLTNAAWQEVIGVLE